MIAEAIRRVVDRHDLTADETYAVFGEIMDGAASDVQKATLLIALRMKGETADEVFGAARAMRERVIPIETNGASVVDTCGTGGDGHGTFNVSTVAAFVTAGAGAIVAKHGNRAVSSSCGSADVLKELGVNIDLDAQRMSDVLQRVGISFLFAPKLHPAMAAVAPIRRELGVRTIFNLLGPLTNPAFARRQVLGVYSRHLLPIVADALRRLGSEHALVVHSEDGMDEISISAATYAIELRDGKLGRLTIHPEKIGIERHALSELVGGDARRNAEITQQTLSGGKGAAREIVVANAGAALYVAGLAGSIAEGVTRAKKSIDSGAAMEKLQQLVKVTNE
jgi:anthranilate phosphoribosyltransferase